MRNNNWKTLNYLYSCLAIKRKIQRSLPTQSFHKALGRRVVWEEKMNNFIPLNFPSVPDLGKPLSGVEISPQKRGQSKNLEQVLLFMGSWRSLSRFLLCWWKGETCLSIPETATVLWATWLQMFWGPPSECFSFMEVDGWDERTSAQLLYFFPLLPLPPFFIP